MPIDPNIALSVQTPQPPNLIQNVGQVMQMRAMGSELALRAAQTQQAQQQTQDIAAQAQQRNRDLADQNTLQQTMQNPDAYSRLMTGDMTPIAGMVQPKTLQALTTWQTAHEKELLANTSEQNTLRSEGLGRIVDTATGLKSLVGADGQPDLGRINSALPEAVQHLQATNAFKDAGITSGIPTQITDPAQLDTWLAQVGGLKAATDKVLGQQKEQAAIQETAATTTQKTAEAGKATAETSHQQLVNQLLQGNLKPGAIQATADQIAPGPQNADINRQYVADMAAAHSEADMSAALTRASEKVAARTPQAVGAKANEAQAVAAATSPIEMQRAQTDAAFQHSLQQGDTVHAKYYESLSDMQQSLSTAATIKKVIDLSQSGNPVAGAQLKAMVPEFTNAVQNIKRMAASQGDKGLASTADSMSSEITSLFKGQPLSSNVMQSIRPYVDTIAAGAVGQHNANVTALQKAYGPQAADLRTEPMPSTASPLGTPKFKVGDSVNYQGKPHTVTAVDPQTGKLTLAP